MNLPVAVAAASMAWKVLPESVTEKRDYSIDPVGMITLLMTAVSLIVGLQQIAKSGFGLFSAGAFAASGIFFILLMYFERKDPAPLLDLSLFGAPSFGRYSESFLRLAFAYFDVLSPAVLLARHFAIHTDPGWFDDHLFLVGDRFSCAGRRLAR